ncbi:hypothetical protein VKT23_004685 [Stygiomarasmius scandens]|uniref:Ubiquitin-like protease family profile domain-containing protein n=1 Tax=Marasmiellus scandens TaxID=2682957 RepID=A0ABR1JZ37_9AGAR
MSMSNASQRRALSNFCTPPPQTPYSTQYFQKLTFSQVSDISLPCVAPRGSLVRWSFKRDVNLSPMATLIQPDDIIPHAKDLTPITQKMEEEYIRGNRSIQLVLQREGRIEIQLYLSINNSSPHVKFAQDVCDALTTSCLSPEIISRFMRERIHQQIHGFSATCALWNLGSLTGEEWLWDDIINCLSELTYLKYAATSRSTTPPSMLFLPTRFIETATRLYSCSDEYNSDIRAFRERLGSATSFGFIKQRSGHFAAYVYSKASGKLVHADSLRWSCSESVAPVSDWILAGVAPRVKVETATDMERQSSESGSCGVAAVNYVQRLFDPSTQVWKDEKSPSIRLDMLEDLVRYHLVAVGAQGRLHPIHEFLRQQHRTPATYEPPFSSLSPVPSSSMIAFSSSSPIRNLKRKNRDDDDPFWASPMNSPPKKKKRLWTTPNFQQRHEETELGRVQQRRMAERKQKY